MSIAQDKNNLISVIIPAYNKADELRASLASLLAQTYRDYEVIIVNDGSTDNTAHIIEEFKHKFSRLRPVDNGTMARQGERSIRYKIIFQNNQGAQNARNRGLVERRGDCVIFWDADVVASPVMLARMQTTLQNHPEVSYAYSSFIYGAKKFALWPFDAERLKAMPCIHTTSLVRAADFPGWDTRVSRLQDWDVWLTMLAKGKTGVWVDETLFTIQTAHGTMSHWLPRFAYKLTPWLKEVKEYKEAVAAIKKKHGY